MSYQSLLRTLEILTLPFQYELSLMNLLIHNLEYVTFSYSVHSINTRKKVQLRRQAANFSSYQKGVYYSGIKVFNILPASVLQLMHFVLA
jgi:hypothetical protein